MGTTFLLLIFRFLVVLNFRTETFVFLKNCSFHQNWKYLFFKIQRKCKSKTFYFKNWIESQQNITETQGNTKSVNQLLGISKAEPGFESNLARHYCCLWCSTCPLVFGCWELSHVIFLVLRKKELLAKLSKFTKPQLL